LDEGGRVEEAEENNNEHERIIVVEWNPAPEFYIRSRCEVDTAMIDEPFEIAWTVIDSNDNDVEFEVFLFWTTDTSGWSAGPEVIYESPWQMIMGVQDAPEGDNITTFTWTDDSPLNEHIYIAGVARDSNPTNNTFALMPGTIWLIASFAPGTSRHVEDYGLTAAYPNPFNRTLSIEYALQKDDFVKLTAYDLSGRLVAELVNGYKSGGRHLFSWYPDALSGGIYLLRLETGGQLFQSKVVYMP